MVKPDSKKWPFFSGLLGNQHHAPRVDRGFPKLWKMGQMIRPAPSHTWVFVDEQADSINNGFLTVFAYYNAWEDLPASYHNGGCGFAFADGHSEIKLWSDPTLKQRVRFDNTYMWGNSTLRIPSEHRADHKWLQERTGQLKAIPVWLQ